MGTSMAMSPAGTLSLRHTDFTLKIDPTQSTTKPISADINFGMAIKAKDVQAIKYHKLKILSAAEQEQRVQQEESLVVKQLKKLYPSPSCPNLLKTRACTLN